jgi:TrmH family RNA methyltransferase
LRIILIFAVKFKKMISKNQIKFIRSLELKKNRKQNGLFVAEGPKVVGDLLHADYKARMLFATKPYPGAELITNDELQRISFLQHPQEILAVFEMPTLNSQPSTLNSQLSLALDGIQDPGNLGTIIRIADWFGISTIYCSPETADVYNPKVVQATMGSLAHVQVVYTDLLALVSQLPPSYPVYGTLLDGENIYQQELTSEGIIVMGNEGNGISQALREHINRRLLIPDFHTGELRAESLNVAIATAITCSEFKRRQ